MALGIYNRIPIYPVFYLLKGDYRGHGFLVLSFGFKV